jgi:hypothetical protein
LTQGPRFDQRPPAKDALPPQTVPSLADGGRPDRVLARLDQDGFAFATDPRDAALFPGRPQELPRKRYRLEIVLHGGAVCVRKQFVRQSLRTGARNWWWNLWGLPFYTEAAALLRLSGCPGVPQVRAIDLATRTIWMDYVQGTNLTHHLAEGGAVLHDLDLSTHPVLRGLPPEQRVERERELFAATLGARCKPLIRELVLAMNARGVAVLDAKPGNVLLGERSGSVYWVDFERAHLRCFPGWRNGLHEQYRALSHSFGMDLESPPEAREFSASASDG